MIIKTWQFRICDYCLLAFLHTYNIKTDAHTLACRKRAHTAESPHAKHQYSTSTSFHSSPFFVKWNFVCSPLLMPSSISFLLFWLMHVCP